MSAERVRGYLMEHGVEYHTHEHAEAFTTAETAEADHVSAKQMAKVVMLKAGTDLVMAVVPGHRRVDLDKAAEALGVDRVRLANEEEFAPSFPDCEVGAEPPFGALYGVPMLVDTAIESPLITFDAGTHTDTLTMKLRDYLELTSPRRAALSA